MTVGLDATYSIGPELSGVGVYSREITDGLARAHPECRWRFYYRSNRYGRSFREELPRGVSRRVLHDLWGSRSADLFHGLNQRLPQRRFKRQVATFHDLFVLSGDYSTPEFRRRFTEQARRAAAGADCIIAVSEFTARQVESLLGVDRTRIRVVHHGLRPLRLHPAEREKIILTVGAIQKRKNIARLVKAFESVYKDWRLVLAGSSGFGSEEIGRAIEQSPCRDRIFVTGYVPAEQLARWYSRAMIFAFPSLDEGFGMPVLEAMSTGIPVLSSNRSALPEVCGGAAILVDPADTNAIAGALAQLADSDELRREYIDRGYRRAAQFTWDRAVAETWAVYREVMKL